MFGGVPADPDKETGQRSLSSGMYYFSRFDLNRRVSGVGIHSR